MELEASPDTDRKITVCPKCGHQQSGAFECYRCGVIFHKYKARANASISASGKTMSHRLSWWGKWVFSLGVMALTILLLYRWYAYRPIVHGPGMIAPTIPKQINLGQTLSFRYKDYVITPLATIDIEARVLSIKKYRFDREADLAPYDIALGWEKMSDEAVLNELRITQSDRFYHWWTQRFPIPRRAIETNSANMHLIPSNRLIAKQLHRVRKGHVVVIKGLLVRADAGNWHWRSSLTRQDTGAGACELIWVVDLAVR
jgi:hypothetical protein